MSRSQTGLSDLCRRLTTALNYVSSTAGTVNKFWGGIPGRLSRPRTHPRHRSATKPRIAATITTKPMIQSTGDRPLLVALATVGAGCETGWPAAGAAAAHQVGMSRSQTGLSDLCISLTTAFNRVSSTALFRQLF